MSYEQQIKTMQRPPRSFAHVDDESIVTIARAQFADGFRAAQDSAAKIAAEADREVAEVRKAVLDLMRAYAEITAKLAGKVAP